MDRVQAVLIGTAISFIILAAGILIYASLTIGSHGKIRTIGIDCDVTEINWGTLDPNESRTAVVHLWGNGTVLVTVNMTAINFQPQLAANYVAYTWNYTGEIIGTDPIAIAITIHIDPDVQGISQFSNELLVVATSVE